MSITNASGPETITDWTFRSSMGVCRRLDYILVSRILLVRESGPSDEFHLGSDHRVVKAKVVSQKKGIQRYYQSKVPMKGWCPVLDEKGNASKYWSALEKSLQENGSMEEAMVNAATAPGIRIEKSSGLKPWQSDEIQELIQKRRFSNTPRERGRLFLN